MNTNQSQISLLFASGLALFTFFVHFIGGGHEIVPLLINSSIIEDSKLTLYACWHLVSISLLFSSIAFFYVYRKNDFQNSRSLVVFISSLWIFFGLVFITIALLTSGPAMIFRLPQWILLIPVGLIGLWSNFKSGNR